MLIFCLPSGCFSESYSESIIFNCLKKKKAKLVKSHPSNVLKVHLNITFSYTVEKLLFEHENRTCFEAWLRIFQLSFCNGFTLMDN